MHAIFLDRDGVICENRPDHVKSWAEFHFLPGVKDSLVVLSQLGLPIIVVTNQAVINRGIISAAVVEEIHQRMVAEITAHGGRIDRVIYCPHLPDEQCLCRKPEPGMLLQVAQEMNLDLTHSYLVGDAASDILAGQRAGCQTFLVLTGRGREQLALLPDKMEDCFMVAPDLMKVTQQIIKLEDNSRVVAGKELSGIA